jgi:hypothetical protein
LKWFSIKKHELSDPVAKPILEDLVDYKLVLAKHFLKKIDASMPFGNDWKFFRLETNCENFLVFCNMAIEIIENRIVNKFNLSIEQDDRSMYKIRDKLQTTDALQRKIKETIEDYCVWPKQDFDRDVSAITSEEAIALLRSGELKRVWNFTKSRLWQLKQMRNHAIHNHILNRSFHRTIGGLESNPTSYIFRFPNPERSADGVSYPNIEEHVTNPHNYFQQMFDDLVDFVDKIRRIIPMPQDSAQHRNDLDFEL